MNALELERLSAGQVGAPSGFATIFKGWNVWNVLAKNSLDFNPLFIGVSPERRARIWIEEQADSGPGVAVFDQANPFQLKGAQVEVIPNASDLEIENNLPGASILLDGPSSEMFVRFYNRGEASTVPWPKDSDFVLHAVYTPSPNNPLTNAPAPGSVSGSASAASDAIGNALKVVAIVGGVAIGAYVLVQLLNARKAVAA